MNCTYPRRSLVFTRSTKPASRWLRRAGQACGLAVLAAIGAWSPASAAETAIPDLPLPAAIAGEVNAVLKVQDPAWLTDRMDQLSGAAGPEHARHEVLLNELLFFSINRSGIDLERPLMVAWRSGESPLVAVLPVAERDVFLREFGTARFSDRFMVRINEREGTMVFSQNTIEGLWEYRLLLSGGYAYLARTAAECRAMAEMPLDFSDDAPPLQLTMLGGFLAEAANQMVGDSSQWFGGSDSALGRLIPHLGMLSAGWPSLLEQISTATFTIEPADSGDDIAVRFVATASAETRLSAWVARQNNTSSRLVSVVASGDDLVEAHGSIRWQGEIESHGRDRIRALEAGGTQLPPEDILALRDLYRLWDRQGSFALAVDLRVREGGVLDPSLRSVIEQPGAADIITHQRRADALLPAGAVTESGAFGAFDGNVAWQSSLSPSDLDLEAEPAAATGNWQRVQVATATHLVEVAETSVEEAAVGARTLLVGLDENSSLSGANGVLAMRIHLDRLFERIALAAGIRFAEADDVAIDVVARVGGQRDLMIQAELPLADMVALLTQTGSWFREPAGDE